MGIDNINKEEVELENTYDNQVFKKIEDILGGKIKAGDMVTKTQKSSFKNTIDGILDENQDNKKLALYIISEIDSVFFRSHKNLSKDIEIVKLAIKKDPYLFYAIDSSLKVDLDIGKETIKSMIRNSWGFDSIEGFIDDNFKNKKKKLIDFYFVNLKIVNEFYKDDISKALFGLKDTNKKLYERFKDIGLITTKTKSVEISEKLLGVFVTDCLNNEDFLVKDKNEQDNLINAHIVGFFNSDYDKLSKDEKYIFDLLLEIINVQFSKKKKKIIDEYEKNNKQDSIEENEKSSNLSKNEKSSEKVDNFDDLIDFSYPECEYYVTSGGYNIETITGKKIFISDSERNNFTSKALENYIKFYNTLYNIGLSFLWDKYSHDFKTLCKNKVGFDYMRGEGITESKTLSVLNLIGKNVGIPEHEVLDKKGKTTNRYKCFNTLADAKSAFGEIKETGLINGKKYSDGSTFGNGAVENKLIEIFCIDPKGNGLNITKWR